MNPTLTDEERKARDVLAALGDARIIATSWEKQGEAIACDPDEGGPGVAGTLAVAYRNRYLPHASLTAYIYSADGRTMYGEADSPAPYLVEESIEYCTYDRPVTDLTTPGGARDAATVWFHYHYRRHPTRYATRAEADAARDRIAATDQGDQYPWDGTEDTPPEPSSPAPRVTVRGGNG